MREPRSRTRINLRRTAPPSHRFAHRPLSKCCKAETVLEVHPLRGAPLAIRTVTLSGWRSDLPNRTFVRALHRQHSLAIPLTGLRRETPSLSKSPGHGRGFTRQGHSPGPIANLSDIPSSRMRQARNCAKFVRIFSVLRVHWQTYTFPHYRGGFRNWAISSPELSFPPSSQQPTASALTPQSSPAPLRSSPACASAHAERCCFRQLLQVRG